MMAQVIKLHLTAKRRSGRSWIHNTKQCIKYSNKVINETDTCEERGQHKYYIYHIQNGYLIWIGERKE